MQQGNTQCFVVYRFSLSSDSSHTTNQANRLRGFHAPREVQATESMRSPFTEFGLLDEADSADVMIPKCLVVAVPTAR